MKKLKKISKKEKSTRDQDNSAKAEKKTAHLFKPGQSGNPGGRKKGSRNKVSILTQNMLLDESEAITRTAIDLALNGDRMMIKLILDKITPAIKHEPVELENMPKIDSVGSISDMTNYIMQEVGSGNLTLPQAEILSKITERHRSNLEVSQLVDRIEQLEKAVENKGC